MNWRDEIGTPRCVASWSTRYASARPINTSPVQSDAAYETATCMDCGASVALERTFRGRLVLAPHSPPGLSALKDYTEPKVVPVSAWRKAPPEKRYTREDYLKDKARREAAKP